MKHLILSIVLLTSALGMRAQSAADAQFFQLPVIPAELVNVQDRTDYLIEHYWDFCDLGKAFSSRDKMAEAFDTYIALMPVASKAKVYEVVPKFVAQLKKPEHLIFIANEAESKLYSDTAAYPSDELFTLFLNEIIKNKKLDKTSKLRYEHLSKVLIGSAPGSFAPKFSYSDAFGGKNQFEVDTTRVGTILFFNDPDCEDCNMARLRLETDILTRRMVQSGKMDIVSIYASDPTSEWIQQAIDYPKEWTVGASEEVNDLYDLRTSPAFYVVNPNGAILLKTGDVNTIIAIMSTLAGIGSDN